MAIGDASSSATWQKKIEHLVRQAIALETKLDEKMLRSDTAFEEYGIESVMVVAITRRLEETFGELAKTLFFEFQSIGELSAYLAQEYPQIATTTAPVTTQAELDQPAPAGAASPAIAAMPSVQVSATPAMALQWPVTASPVAPPPSAAVPVGAVVRVAAPVQEDDIAIIGMSGRFPMADTMEQFWGNLVEGRNCISEVPETLWNWRQYWTTEKGVEGKSYTRWGGFMNDIDKFDPLFFNISNLEAQSLDPQERLFLQTVYHTIEDAGYAREQLSGKKIGVYAGAMWGQYQLYGADTANAGSSYSSIANRVSYYFNFTGPSIGLDTMCSSSLTTVHLACESLKRGETELAIAGGVNITVHPNKYLFLSKTGFASTEGLCRSYGEGGDGYVPGDGVGALLLKPLSAAERDGDRIYGIIRGTAINHGGKANAYTVPNPKLQTALIREALHTAGIDPRTISYMEGHGTGTALGDPIEVRALTQAFSEHTDELGFCALGSIKSNIGHLESAAGFAGIAKVLLQMRHRQLVPSIHSEVLNSNIDFAKTPFVVQRTLAPWNQMTLRQDGRDIRVPRRAGVSSFGAGGANGHVILEEYVASAAPSAREPEVKQLFVFSAKNHEQMHAVVRQFLASFEPVAAPVKAAREVDAAQRAAEVMAVIADALGVSAQLLDTDDNWDDLAVDTAAADKLAQRLNQAFDCALAADEVLQSANVGQLSARIRSVSAATLDSSASDAERFERIAYTLQVGREALSRRLALEADSFDLLRSKLERFLAGDDSIDACWTSPKSNRDRVQSDGEQDREFLRMLVQGRRWSKLGRLWCQGATVPWVDGYRGLSLRRIDLPLYPFAKERCWVPTAPAIAAAAAHTVAIASQASPTLNSCLIPQRSMGGALTFELPLTAADLVLQEGEQPASSLRTGRALALLGAAADYFQGVRTLADLRWQHRATGAAPPQLAMTIDTTAQGPVAQLSGAESAELACAKLRPASGGNGPVSTITDVAHWYRNCRHKLPDLSVKGTGADSCSLSELGCGDDFALARYTVTGAVQQPWEMAALLVSAAIELIAAAHLQDGIGDCVQFSAEQLRLVDVPTTDGYLFLRPSGKGTFAVDMLDAQGSICLTLQGMRAQLSEPVFDRMFYRPQWQVVPADELAPLATPASTPEGATLLVYPAAAGFVATALKARLGSNVYEIVLDVKTAVLSAQSWSVGPADTQALPACIEHIGQVGSVYFLGGVNLSQWHPRTSKDFRDLQTGSVTMLLRLVQAIEKGNQDRRQWALRIVTNAVFQVETDDIIQPFTAGLVGFAKALPNELSHVHTQLLDIALAEGSHEMTPALLADLDRVVSGAIDNQQLALRGGKAFRRTLLPLALPAATQPVLQDNGVYLIIGGAGNVGVRISQYLASACGANIAWIGRRPSDEEIVAKLATVSDDAARVRYYSADISDDKKLSKAIQKAETELGPIRAVFHSAMTFAGGRLATLTDSEFVDALQAKTVGSHALYRALRGRALDFLMFFSSGESFVGNKGWGAYTVACNFQDAFALHLRQETDWPVHVVNWGFWEGNDRGDPELLRAKGIFPLKSEQGGEAITRIVAANLGQAMALNVSDAVLQRMGVKLPQPAVLETAVTVRPTVPLPQVAVNRQAKQLIAQNSKVAHVDVALTLDAVAQSVRMIVADTLMIAREKIDIDADLADFGVDSLIVVNLHRALEELAGTLPATLFLNYQSIREVAEYLIANHVEQAVQLLGGKVSDWSTTAATVAVEPSSAVVTAPPEPLVATQRYPGAKLLRTVAGVDIEDFLFTYGDLYRDGKLAVATADAPDSFDMGSSSPDDLQHLLFDVPSCPQVEVFVTGQGTPLLFMPAVALTIPVWLKQIQSLRAHYRLIVIHAPGYGLSKGIRESTTAGVSRVFSEVLKVLLMDQPVHLVSSCFGSIAASYIARFYPQQVASLTMVGGFYDGLDLPPVAGDNLSIDEIMQMIQVVSGSLKIDFDTVAAQWGEADPLRLNTERMGNLLIGSQCANPLVAMRYLNEMTTLSTLDWVRQLQTPVQFLFGDLDTVIRPLHSHTMHEQLPGSMLIDLSGSGHYPFLTHNAQFDQLLTQFVQRVEQQASGLADAGLALVDHFPT